MKWEEVEEELLKNDELRKEYIKVDLAYEIGHMVSSMRTQANMTQSQLAQKIGTKQPSIARIERGSSLPSFSFLQKIAKAFGTQLLPPSFGMAVEADNIYNNVITFTLPIGGKDKVPIFKSNVVFQKEHRCFGLDGGSNSDNYQYSSTVGKEYYAK